MVTLAADTPLQTENTIRNTKSYIIQNGVQLYIGALVMFVSGYMGLFAPASGTVCAGFVVGPGIPGGDPNVDAITSPNAIAPGNTGLAVGNQPEAVIEQGEVVIRQVTLAVAGTLVGSAADNGVTLYGAAASTNIADATTTQTSTDKPLGTIERFWSKSGSTAVYDIRLLSYSERKGA